MYLKSLTLKGFKSFADRTHMTFDPGLTVVVGPNGSGKSNVSDGILWVLGEQSAKMLRGQAMEDVIFSGSSARQAVGIAEVTLVLDNSDHTLPVEFSEVGITRRMYRSGESEYLINGSPSRLRDIQDILHDSGLGKDTHSIISQGKLDSVLASRPEERRVLIEEAAGISKHRRRKERSERKLARMDDNLTRAKDIQRVINRQLRPLERQVDKAKRANDIAQRLGIASTTLAVDDLRNLQYEYNSLSHKEKEAQANLELCEYRLAEKRRELEKLQVMLEQKGLFVGDLDAQRSRMQQMLSQIDSDMRLLEEKGKNMVSRLSEMRMNISNIKKEKQDAITEKKSCESDFIETQKAVALLQEEVEKIGPEAADAREARTRIDNLFQQKTNAMRQEQKTCDAQTLSYARLKEQISNAEIEEGMFASRIAAIQESVDINNQALDEREKKRDEVKSALDASTQHMRELSCEIDSLKAQQKEVKAQVQKALDELSQTRASYKALCNVDEAQENTSPLVSTIAKDSRVADKVSSRLVDLIQVPAELEDLVEQILGADLQALVVDTIDDCAQVASVAAAHSTSAGSATVCVRQGMGHTKHQGQAGPHMLMDRLEVMPGAESMVEQILGSICIASSFEEALALHSKNPNLTYVTLDKQFVLEDGRCVFGEASTQQKGALERKRKIRNLSQLLPEKQKAYDTSQTQHKTLAEALQKAQDSFDSARSEVASYKGDLASVTSEIARLQSQKDSLAHEMAEVSRRRQETQEKTAQAKAELEGHKLLADQSKAKVESLEEELVELGDKKQEALDLEKSLSASLAEARLNLATVTERMRHLKGRMHEVSTRVEELDERLVGIERSARALEVMRLRVDPLYERYSKIQKVAWAWASRLKDRASLAEADSESLKKTIGDARREVGKAHGKADEAKARVGECKVLSGRLEVQVENAIQAITADGIYTLEDALALPAPEDREALEQEVSSLKRQLDDIGPVNQVAMDEYSRLKEKSDYITSQVKDLEAAKKSLLKIAAAIDKKMRRQFLLTFELVNTNFQEIFAILFPGGKAHLEMLDPDHPDETGVEIVAQPKGKRITKMMLMSGGEKSLTALALLFAVYKTRTVPFYVFDEVEAALDASNLDKLLYAIEQLKQHTQLIVISHQRRTMEQADVLYGVSMQADGVSHVVSQRLDKTTGKVVDA